MIAQPERRMLLVHAHPDDETINNGATMAKYAAEGVQVTLVTCTRGEQGEVIPEQLAHLVADASGGTGRTDITAAAEVIESVAVADAVESATGADTSPGASRLSGADSGAGADEVPGEQLGDHRVGELAAAMAELGVTDHRFLGDLAGPGRRASEVLADGGTVYRDSGMAYDRDGGVVPSPDPPAGAFARTDVEQPAAELAALIRQLRPDVVVTYEPGGGYGHPDHVQAHLLTMRAVELAVLDGPVDEKHSSAASPGVAGVAGWAVPKVYWTVLPESLMRATLAAIATAEGTDYQGADPSGRLPSMVMSDDQVTTAIDAMDFTAAKVAGLRAHETQVSVSADSAFYALSNGVRHPVMGLEFYRLVRGTLAAARDDLKRETTLF
jgi:N-acetyl-1-D-myo-inositol-2-amino-2-deoxy-alpha-D-glucopyranoside deacetylase